MTLTGCPPLCGDTLLIRQGVWTETDEHPQPILARDCAGNRIGTIFSGVECATASVSFGDTPLIALFPLDARTGCSWTELSVFSHPFEFSLWHNSG
jgi:hypothetical protein